MPVQVLLERLLRLPGGAVDALELLVLLVAAPVRRRGAHQLERRDPLGGRQVRAAAQVAPGDLAVAADVVVDGELAGADLSRGTFDRLAGRPVETSAAFKPDQLDLVGLVLELVERVGVGGDPPGEPLALLDDLAHPGLDLLEVLGHERGLDVEVVVEAVADRRPDPEPGVRVEVLDRLRHHVRGRVPQDVVAVGAVDRDALDLVAVLELVGQVLERAVHAGGDDALVVRNGSHALVPVVTARSSRAPAWTRAILRSDMRSIVTTASSTAPPGFGPRRSDQAPTGVPAWR